MIISKTPLRASFFGGGTDFKDYYENSQYGYGVALSTTLDMYVYIMVCKRFDGCIRVCYRKQELVESVDEIEHNIVREALKMAGIEKGIDVVYSADIPISTAGVGLASSSAFAVGILNALYAYKGIHITQKELARKACEIEIEHMDNPIGIQDQYAVSYGGFRQYSFWRDGEVTAEPVICGKDTIEELRRKLMMFYTGITRISSDILSEQKKSISDNMGLLDALVYLEKEAYDKLCERKVDSWGKLLDKAWNIKKKMSSGISNGEIDTMYEKAISAGAEGGKVLGAGGGGFLLLFVPEDKQQNVRTALSEYREMAVHFETAGSRVIFSE